MADIKISNMSAAGTLDGTEIVPVIQGGANKRTTVQAIADLASGDGGDIIVSTISVSSSELLNMHSSPKVLVAARGVDKIIVPIGGMLHYIRGSVSYTDSHGLYIAYGDENNTDFTVFGSISGDEFTKSTSVSSILLPDGGGFGIVAQIDSSLVNRPLVMGTRTANMAAGDGTAVVLLVYGVLSL